MENLQIGLGIIGAIVGLVLLFPIFFGNLEGFLEAVKYCLTPDIISLFQGDWGADRWNELKMFVWLTLSILLGFAVYTLVGKVTGAGDGEEELVMLPGRLLLPLFAPGA